MAPFKSWRRLIKSVQMMNYSKINSCKKLFLFLFFIPGLLQEKSVDQ